MFPKFLFVSNSAMWIILLMRVTLVMRICVARSTHPRVWVSRSYSVAIGSTWDELLGSFGVFCAGTPSSFVACGLLYWWWNFQLPWAVQVSKMDMVKWSTTIRRYCIWRRIPLGLVTHKHDLPRGNPNKSDSLLHLFFGFTVIPVTHHLGLRVG